MTWPDQDAAANGLSAVRSNVAGVRERAVRSTAAEAVAQLGRYARKWTSMKTQLYRNFIDQMVNECLNGQGAIGPTRARRGVWNKNATAVFLKDQFRINQLLATLDDDQREVIAGMLAHAFEGGVFETLKALEEFEIEPFLEGYEGSPYHDFIGRLASDQWQWPNDDEN